MSARLVDALRRLVASPAGGPLRRLESQVAPRLPRELRNAWRRTLGRPPLPPPRVIPALLSTDPASDARVAEILRVRGGPDVVCLPIIDWSFRHQRPQQLALQIARAGRRVFWVEPGSLKTPRFLDADEPLPLGEIAERLYTLDVATVRALDHFNDAMTPDDVLAMAASLERLRRDAGIVSAIVLVQLPFWTPLALHLRAAFGWRVVYDCMDYHAGFESNSQGMLGSEDRLIAEADATVVTSEVLRAHVGDRARAVALVPNACEFEHFAPADGAACAAELASLPRPIVGYFGAISAWFDFALLRHAVQAHPEWSFVLIGSTWGAPPHDDLRAAPNVHFLGELPYDALPSHLACFDVATIPFQLTPLIAATSPVKFFEYLAAGKPVVASRLPELVPHPDLARLADGPEDFTRALEEALRDHTPERVAARRAFARESTWPQRCADLLRAADATFPLVTIAIVTWNNLHHTRKCLASVLGDATWPRIEVVIVDNGSSDGTVEELDALARRDPRVRLVRNADNRGFAAANNQAIDAARGAFVILLNNDTVVSSGWIARLVRVLEEDPRIGLVGPVSDAVWNEALVYVDPDDIARFPLFAERWAREHEHELYPIRMLAMFCIAGRTELWRSVGPLDERFGIGMFEDDDYAYRVRLGGHRLACAEEVFIHHAGHASFDKLKGRDALYEANRAKFDDKWSTRWHPYRGDRQATRLWSRRVRELVAKQCDTKPCVLILADEDRSAAALVADDLGRACADAGAVVLVHTEPDDPARQGLVAVADGVFLAALPLEAFEDLRGLIVVALPGRRFETAWAYRPARVVVLDDGWRARCAAIAADLLSGAPPAPAGSPRAG